MLDQQKIIILIIILVIIYLWPNIDTFACSDHNKGTVINSNACFNDEEGCAVMNHLSGNTFCTSRNP